MLILKDQVVTYDTITATNSADIERRITFFLPFNVHIIICEQDTKLATMVKAAVVLIILDYYYIFLL